MRIPESWLVEIADEWSEEIRREPHSFFKRVFTGRILVNRENEARTYGHQPRERALSFLRTHIAPELIDLGIEKFRGLSVRRYESQTMHPNTIDQRTIDAIGVFTSTALFNIKVREGTINAVPVGRFTEQDA